MASILSKRSRIQVKSGRITSTPGWCSSGNKTPQSTTRSRPACSKTVMLRPISPTPPRGTTRSPSAAKVGNASLRLGARRLIGSPSMRWPGRRWSCGGYCEFSGSRSAFVGVGVALEGAGPTDPKLYGRALSRDAGTNGVAGGRKGMTRWSSVGPDSDRTGPDSARTRLGLRPPLPSCECGALTVPGLRGLVLGVVKRFVEGRSGILAGWRRRLPLVLGCCPGDGVAPGDGFERAGGGRTQCFHVAGPLPVAGYPVRGGRGQGSGRQGLQTVASRVHFREQYRALV